jgi:hypothetical protein
MTQVHGAELSPFRAATSWAASFALLIILLPEAAVPQEVKTCPGLPGKYVILENQPYALCAGAPSVNFNAITYAKCSILHGNSLSIPQTFPFPSLRPKGNISTVNQGAPESGGYIVSTYSPPAGAIVGPSSSLAVYTCEAGTAAQCDGGICFTSTTGKSSPLWGPVDNNEIICSCPVVTLPIPFEVMGPFPCPATAAGFDRVCGTRVSAINNGATIYIGGPAGGFVKGAACLTGITPNFNTCTRPEQ